MTSFVVLGRDRRTYRFLKDTRLGRTVILESAKLEDMADTITHYVAERIVERERALEGDWLSKRVMRGEVSRRGAAAQREELRRVEAREALAEATDGTAARRRIDERTLGWVVAAFLGGILIGVAVLFGYAWVAVG
jgi:hypothetical protein